MKITFLGSGSAFVTGKENYHSNILIEENSSKMLYDAGTSINDALDLRLIFQHFHLVKKR